MQIVIDISEEEYKEIKSDAIFSPRNLTHYERAITVGMPLEDILVEFANWYDVPFGHDKFMSLPECGVKEFLRQRDERSIRNDKRRKS